MPDRQYTLPLCQRAGIWRVNGQAQHALGRGNTSPAGESDLAPPSRRRELFAARRDNGLHLYGGRGFPIATPVSAFGSGR